jgi:hypothetical protein
MLAFFNGEDPEFETKRVNFNVLPRDQSRSFLVKKAFSVPKLNVNSRTIYWPGIKRQWKHLEDLDLPVIDSSKVTVLLGSDVLRIHDNFGVRILQDGVETPDGILTHFVWSLAGPVPSWPSPYFHVT